MPEILLEVRGNPKAQKRHRSGRGWTYDPSESDKADLLALVHEKAPEVPLECPVAIRVRFYMPIPKSWPKYKKKMALQINPPHAKKPDIDNLVKLVLDTLEGVFFMRDSQVYCLRAYKYYSNVPETVIEINWKDNK